MYKQGKSNLVSTKYIRTVMVFVVSAGAVALYWSFRLAAADWLENQADLRTSLRTIALAPGNETYLRRAGELADAAGGDGTTYYRKAVTVDRYASHDWVQLAFDAERDGRSQDAERDLLQAARVDQSFEPPWALANFYFRGGNATNTLFWASKSLRIGQGDLTAVFRLCWETSADAAVILRDAIPNRALVLGQYVSFLAATNRFDESTPVVIKLMEVADRNQVSALLDYCDLALTSGHPDEALTVWNALSRRNLMPEPAIGSNAEDLVLNANFRAPLNGRGFGWKTGIPEGVWTDNGGPDGLRIEFSGKQPDKSVILSQYVHLRPASRCGLRVRYESQGIPAGSGLRWRVLDPVTGRDIEDASLELPATNGESASTEFQVPPNVRWGQLQLLYERRPGSVHIRGSLRLILVDIAINR